MTMHDIAALNIDMRRIFPLILFLFIGQNLLAQHALQTAKMDQALVKERLIRGDSERIQLLVRMKKDGASLPESDKLKINSTLGSILSIEVEMGYLRQLILSQRISELYYGGLESPTMDSARISTGALSVHKGWGAIDRAYQGENVIIGIIDSGVDFKHPAFRKEDDSLSLRIRSIWCQWDANGNKPNGFSYGSEYNRTEMEAELSRSINGSIPRTDFDPTYRGGLGHGTHVAGIAAGLKGMAPKAEIIGVSVLWTSASIIDAVSYIFEEAKKAGKPCVINLSLGSSYDIHDGTGIKAEAYRALALQDSSGNVIVTAAGNNGSAERHWGNFPLNDTSQFIYVHGDPIHLAMAVADSHITDMQFRVKSYVGKYDYKENTYQDLQYSDQTDWIRLGDLIADSMKSTFYNEMTEAFTGGVKVLVAAKDSPSVNHFVEIIIGDSSDIDVRQDPPKTDGIDLYQIEVKGKGIFNAWLMGVSSTYEGSFARFVNDPTEVGAELPSRYIIADGKLSILSPAVYKETFCVGAYVNRWVVTDINGKRHPGRWARKPSGSLATFSSRGPSVDQRILPEICAPGQNVYSAAPPYYSSWSPRVYPGNQTSSSGTSMACPVVSGAVALYLEQNPNASLQDVRRDFLTNVSIDEHTQSAGNLPNSDWGYGKLDIYKVLSKGIIFGQKERNNNEISIYPNPTAHSIHIPVDFSQGRIFNAQGKLVIEFTESQITVAGWTSGVYMLQIETKDNVLTSKFMVK